MSLKKKLNYTFSFSLQSNCMDIPWIMQPTGSQILTCKNESANKKERKNVRNEQIVVIKLGKSV